MQRDIRGMRLRHIVLSTTISVAWAIATVASMMYGTTYNWPDYLHVDYGFPITFATHTLNTIAGPVDRWNLNVGSLAADLAFWSVGMVFVFLIVELLARPSRPRESRDKAASP